METRSSTPDPPSADEAEFCPLPEIDGGWRAVLLADRLLLIVAPLVLIPMGGFLLHLVLVYQHVLTSRMVG